VRFLKIFFALSLWISLSACDGETIFKGMMWGMQQLAGEGYLPSAEILAIGAFEGAEVAMSQAFEEGTSQSFIELRLYNGKSRQLLLDEENTARKCAEMYVSTFSKSKKYEEIKIILLFQDPANSENYTLREYVFPISDLID
jgi:hypothetical protein